MLKPIPNSSRINRPTINTNNVAQRSDLLIRPTAILDQYINGTKQYAYGGQPTMRDLDFGEAGVGAASGALAGAAAGLATGPLAPIAAPVGAAIGAIVGFIGGVFSDDAKRKEQLEKQKAAFEEQVKKEDARTDEIKEELNVTSKASEGKGYYAAMGISDIPNEELSDDTNYPLVPANVTLTHPLNTDKEVATHFINDWFRERSSVFERNVTTHNNKYGTSVRNIFKSTKSIAKEKALLMYNNNNSVKSIGVDKTDSDTHIDKPDPYVDKIYNKLVISDGTPLNVDNYKSLKYLIRGVYDGDAHTILYPEKPSISTRIHEHTHAMGSISPPVTTISTIIDKHKKNMLDVNVDPDTYLDKNTEIYARLMQLRYDNKLDPKKVYKKEDLVKLRNNKNTKDVDILHRYTDGFILDLLNNTASNKPNVDMLPITSNGMDYYTAMGSNNIPNIAFNRKFKHITKNGK